jgi:phosphomethylpyrimidine synthase
MATRLAGHAADIAKGVDGALAKDIAMSRARKALDWEAQYGMALDPVLARKRRETSSAASGKHGACTMCGAFCAYKIMDERKDKENCKLSVK